jgi:hypothetical protein
MSFPNIYIRKKIIEKNGSFFLQPNLIENARISEIVDLK